MPTQRPRQRRDQHDVPPPAASIDVQLNAIAFPVSHESRIPIATSTTFKNSVTDRRLFAASFLVGGAGLEPATSCL